MTHLSEIIKPIDNPSLADSVLFEFFDICSSRKIPVFLALGTALGFYRSGNYLPNDSDLDVFILCSKEVREHLLKFIPTCGFALNTISGASPYRNVHSVKNSIFLDIWFKHPKSFMKFYHGDCFFYHRNRKLRIPFDIEGYLSCIYEDWKTPSNQCANCMGA